MNFFRQTFSNVIDTAIDTASAYRKAWSGILSPEEESLTNDSAEKTDSAALWALNPNPTTPPSNIDSGSAAASAIGMEVATLKSKTKTIAFSENIIVNGRSYSVTCDQLVVDAAFDVNDKDYINKTLIPRLIFGIEKATSQQRLQTGTAFELVYSKNGILTTPLRQKQNGLSSDLAPASLTDGPKTDWERGQTISLQDEESLKICAEVQSAIDRPFIVRRQIQTGEWRQLKTYSQPSREPHHSSPPQLLTPLTAPIAFINHEPNSCYLATMVWTLLLNNPFMLEKLQNIPKPNRLERKPRSENEVENEVLRILKTIVEKCESAKGTNTLVSGIGELRGILCDMGLELLDENPNQQDVSEVWTRFISPLIIKHSKSQNEMTITRTYESE